MPAHTSRANRWRDSWPPTQVHLQPPVQEGDGSPDSTKTDTYDVPRITNNPNITFFPTPNFPYASDEDVHSGDDDGGFADDADDISDEDEDFMDFDLDAGIEGATPPMPIVRAVSPSTLNGVTLPEPRPPTPPRSRMPRFAVHVEHAADDMACDDDSDDSDSDDCDVGSGISNGSGQVPFATRYAASLYAGRPSRWTARERDHGHRKSLRRVSSCSSLSASAAVGSGGYLRQLSRCGTYPAYGQCGTSLDPYFSGGGGLGMFDWQRDPIVRHMSPRSWRSPSPAVYSIREETEEDLAENEERPGVDDDDKPKKQVRFALPRSHDLA